jgi:hypothetical protein
VALCFTLLQVTLMKIYSRRSIVRGLLAASVAVGLPSVATAADGCCVRCGCRGTRCRKVCRLVKEERKITTTCWGMECEDFCMAPPSTPDCKQCEMVGGKGPDEKNICAQPKRLVWTSWIPGCGPEVFTKRKLMKKTVTKTVPSFKWVVEDMCAACTAQLDPVTVPAGTPIPAAPKSEGAMVVAVVEE